MIFARPQSMTSRSVGVVSLLWVVCAQLSPAQAQPAEPPTEEAIEKGRAHLKRANELYEAGEFKLALAEFERAYAVAPNYRILYNIGQMHLQLNSYAAALAAFERFLTEGGDEIDAERRASVAGELPRLRARTGTLSVSSNVQGAEVRVDGVVVGVTPLSGLRLDAGVHNVILTKDGRSTSEIVTVGGDDSQVTLEVELKFPEPGTPPAPVPVVQPVPKPQPDTQEDEIGAGVWISWSITGALTLAAVGTGVAALSAQNEHEDKLAAVTSAEELEASSATAKRLSIATDVLIGVAAAAGAVSLIVTILDVTSDDGPKVEAALSPSSAAMRVSF